MCVSVQVQTVLALFKLHYANSTLCKNILKKNLHSHTKKIKKIFCTSQRMCDSCNLGSVNGGGKVRSIFMSVIMCQQSWDSS